MLRIARVGLFSLIVLPLSHAWGGPPEVRVLEEYVLPQSISNDGAVVAGLSIDENEPGVIRWTPDTGLTALGGLLAGHPDVSADGATIAATIMTDVPEAALWTAQRGWIPLSASGAIPALPGWATLANAISANGERIAGGTIPSPVDYGWERAFSFNPDMWDDRWSDYGWQELPKVGKGGVAWASGISNDGAVQVGSASERSTFYFAVRWVNGLVEELRDGEGQRLGGETVACNSDCSVIVGGGGGSSLERPVLAWRLRANSRAPACHFEPLKGPPLLHLRHYAHSSTESGGLVIGAYYFDVVDDFGWIRNVAKGFMWIADRNGGTLVDLQEYLALHGQHAFEEWTDVVPVAVSADGRYMVGWGADAHEVIRGWRIDFGAAPRADGALPASASYTMCPKHASPVRAAPVSSTVRTQVRVVPEGVFRRADGRDYLVTAQGRQLYGAADGGRPSQLVQLGGDHYYDVTARARLSFVRDASGRVTAVRESGNGRTSLWHRRSD